MYEDILKIDPLSLDKEWLNQPGLFMYWAQKAVEAREVADMCRLRADIVQNTLLVNIRKDPKGHGIDKITESAINQQVAVSEDYIKAQKKLIKARTEAESLSKLVIALEQRRKALENLCFLQNQGYYSQPQEETILKRKERLLKGLKRAKDEPAR